MLRLLLLRHAKSDWSEGGIGDHDRPLARRGLKAAALMGHAMGRQGYHPAACLTSSARRARDTARLTLAEMPGGTDVPVTASTGLYDFGNGREVAAAIAGHGGNASPLLVVGHNPAVHRLALRLAGAARKADLAQMQLKFPTAALAVFDLDIGDWSKLPGKEGSLVAFIRPKAINSDD